MDALKKIMEKKISKEGEMEPSKKKAKMELLQELRSMAEGMMKEDLDGHMGALKKVTVASDSKEGLKEGLEKAEEVVEGDEEELPGLPEAEDDDMSMLSKEELLAKLMELKRKA